MFEEKKEKLMKQIESEKEKIQIAKNTKYYCYIVIQKEEKCKCFLKILHFILKIIILYHKTTAYEKQLICFRKL